ncbi:MAG: hypothetical protein V2I53_12295 [Paracoccaceae bacterium]|jgi:hypothetical protein|nr:hypothetical protein [Paracoccaceae bacterium]
MPRLTALPLALMIALSGPALAYQPLIPLEVRATTAPGTFEVIESRGAGPSHIWCVAADHARHVLRASGTQRLTVVSPLGASQTKPGSKAVTFTIAAETAASVTEDRSGFLGGVFLSVKRVGASMNVTQALQYCTDHIEVD